MTENILITGGCGFIGTSLIGTLKQTFRSSSIVILDNFSTGTAEDLSEVTQYSVATPQKATQKTGVILVEGDIRDIQTTIDITKDIDTIIHLAANTGVGPSVTNPRLDLENNVIGTFNMLEASRYAGVKKFIFASSGAPAGLVSPPIHEELPPHPVSPYGSSKLAGEGYCSAYSNTYNISTVCLRFGNVYGPRSKKKSSVIAKFIRQAIEGKPCVIYGDGNQTRDFIYIDDLIQAIISSIKTSIRCETFQIAGGRERTITEIAFLIRDLLGPRGIDMKILYDSPRLGDVLRNYSDTSKAKKVLNWQAKMDIQSGIEKSIDYFLAFFANKSSS